MAIQTVKWTTKGIRLIDQRKLPAKLQYVYCRDLKSLWHAIKTLTVRGAPAIGVTAAYGIRLAAEQYKGTNKKAFLKVIFQAGQYLASSRPTAVNLFYAIERMQKLLERFPEKTVTQWKTLLRKEAEAIKEEDRKVCRAIGQHGASLIKSHMRLLTVCNAGALATVDYGTALGVMYAARKAGKKFSVFSCESRPLLQGARLTCWELMQEKIPVTLICDNMAAFLMAKKQVDLIIAGADRITANGDAANKIGTYSLAVLAQYHRIPFFIAAPFSTFDLTLQKGEEIPIEERSPAEVTSFGGCLIAPRGVNVFNPAFDVTPHTLISGIITEKGIIYPPYVRNIKKIIKR